MTSIRNFERVHIDLRQYRIRFIEHLRNMNNPTNQTNVNSIYSIFLRSQFVQRIRTTILNISDMNPIQYQLIAHSVNQLFHFGLLFTGHIRFL